MIIKDSKTLAQALAIVSEKPIRYSDASRYVLATDSATLNDLATEALERGDIAIVVPAGQERYAEDHDQELKVYRRQRKDLEKRLIRKWVDEHPDAIEAALKRQKKGK